MFYNIAYYGAGLLFAFFVAFAGGMVVVKVLAEIADFLFD
jgi:hypothetical protein